jgi:hypothetical protein
LARISQDDAAFPLPKKFFIFFGEGAALLLYLVIPKDGSVGSSGSGGETRAAFLFLDGLIAVAIP